MNDELETIRKATDPKEAEKAFRGFADGFNEGRAPERESILYRPELLNVRIESNGTPYDCRIVDIDSGKPLNNVVAATWSLMTGKESRGEATIILTLLPVKITGTAMVQYTCDGCRQKMIEAEHDLHDAEVGAAVGAAAGAAIGKL